MTDKEIRQMPWEVTGERKPTFGQWCKEACVHLLLLVLLGLMVGCITRSGVAGGTVVEHTKRIAELEATNRELARRIELYDSAVTASIKRLENVRRGADGIGNTVEQLVALFERYDRAVRETIDRLDKVSNETKNDD
jgi:hypothetical protein